MTTPLHFTLVMPHYTPSSNGVMVLYFLADTLEQLGHRTTLVPLDREVFIQNRHNYPARYLEKFQTHTGLVDPESIAIIPETAPAATVASLTEKKRVWYLLNKPMLLTGEPIMYAPEDLVVVHSGLISKAYFNLFIVREIPELNLENLRPATTAKENLILLYYGKSRMVKIPSCIKRLIKSKGAEVVIINRHFPKSRDLLFDLLKKARLLVSYDPLTNLNYEATLCGTPCYIVDNYMQLKFSDFNIPLHGIFEDKQEIGHYYNQGLNHELVIRHYKAAVAGSRPTIEEFAHLCTGWFDLASQLNQSKAGRSLLFQQNELRILTDQLSHIQTGSLRISMKLHGYTPPAVRIRDRIENRLYRTKRKIFRAWYKYFCRISGVALDEKLRNV